MEPGGFPRLMARYFNMASSGEVYSGETMMWRGEMQREVAIGRPSWQ
jgi:hypothetical protein